MPRVTSQSNNAALIKFEPLSEIIGQLKVGTRILFNGDGGGIIPFRFLSGKIVHIEQGSKHTIHVLRDDGVEGRGYEKSWYFSDEADAQTLSTMMIAILPITTLAKPASFQKSDVFYAEYGDMASQVFLTEYATPDRLIVYPLSDEPQTRPYTLDIDDLTNIKYYGKIENQRCDLHPDKLAKYFNNDMWMCDQHGTMPPQRYCSSCNILLNMQYAHEVDGHRYMCDECYQLRNNRGILSYGYKPAPKFIKEPTETANRILYLGVELETELVDDNDANEKAVALLKIYQTYNKKRWFYIKGDGSLHNGMEIVTEPATLYAHRRLLPWKDMLVWLKAHNIGSDDFSTTGLHVHINRSFLNQEESIKLGYFVNTHRDMVEWIARRQQNHYAQFVENPTLTDAITSRNDNRYKVLNWQNQRTIEWRIFKGTIIYKHLMEAMEFVDASARFAKEGRITARILQNVRDAWRNFEDYVTELSRDYPELYRLMESSASMSASERRHRFPSTYDPDDDDSEGQEYGEEESEDDI